MLTAPNTPLTPTHIDASRPFWEAFGSSEVEDTARIIVLFLQWRAQGFAPFSLAELGAFNTRQLGNRQDTFTLEELAARRPPLVKVEDGMAVVTVPFIARFLTAAVPPAVD